MLSFATFLVNTVLNTVNNLIYKFTLIAILAILGVLLIAILQLPVIRYINLYEEKILMIVTRINSDQAQIEKLKLAVCTKLIDLERLEWLKFNFSSVIAL